jgi:predicted phosphohydrolase
MATYAWATDIHLDHLGDDQQKLIKFGESLIQGNPTGILLTGDISVARKLTYHLSAVEKIVQRPIYFVLGNHDYYGGTLEPVRKAMRELTNLSPFLRYMPTMPYLGITQSTAIVGHDGWYDALLGDWQNSNFQMSDWTAIGDFIPVNGNKATIVTLARKLAHEGVQHVHNGIKQAVRYHKNIVVLTHFPPFPQCHVYQGKQGDAGAMPWFTSKFMGDMLMDASKAFPQCNFTVMCGHTHGKWDGQITPNLTVHVGAADYGSPMLQGTIDLA